MRLISDINRPRQFGGQGRLPILSEFESTTMALRLSFRAMMLAAETMTMIRDGILELTPACNVEDVLSKDTTLREVQDPTGLFLNSLLIPVTARLIHENFTIRFAHRAYQEFFLALYCAAHPNQFENVHIQSSVQEIINDMLREGIGKVN